MNGKIYKVTSPSGKIYIGKTIQELSDRKNRHFKKAFETSNGNFILNIKFSCAIRKYKDTLTWEIIKEDIKIEDLDKLEIYYISLYNSYNNGYNSTLGGSGGDTYNLLSEQQLNDVKEKISTSLKKTFSDPKYFKQKSERFKGNKNPMFGKQSAMKNKKHTEESKNKISRQKKIRDLCAQEYPKIIEKPWGSEYIISYNKHYCFKRIVVKKGHVTSLQYHNLKHETTYINEGKAKIWLKRKGENDFTIYNEVGPGAILELPPGDIHRIEALEDVVLFEASTPETWDVVRLEDSYNRAGTSTP